MGPLKAEQWEAALRKSLDIAKELAHFETTARTRTLLLRLMGLLASSNRTAIAAASDALGK